MDTGVLDSENRKTKDLVPRENVARMTALKCGQEKEKGNSDPRDVD